MNQPLFEYMKVQAAQFRELTEGAYLNFLQDSVELFNKQNGTSYNPYETMMEYIKLTSSKG